MSREADVVAEMVNILEDGGRECPEENRKNIYLKACWVLAEIKRRGRIDPRMKEAAGTLAEILPKLRALTP